MEPEQYALMARVERDHWWYRGMRRLAAALLDEQLVPGPTRRVLDAGCGTGGTTAWLRRYGAVVGVDLAAEAAPFWCDRGLHAMARGSVAALPFAANRFDLVTCFDVLYHQQVADEGPALAEFCRVLRPGGLLHFVSDVEAYYTETVQLVTEQGRLRPVPVPELGEAEFLTNFERKYRLEGRPIYRARFECPAMEPR